MQTPRLSIPNPPFPSSEIVEVTTSAAASTSSVLTADGRRIDAAGDTDAATNGAVRRRPADTLPMEVT